MRYPMNRGVEIEMEALGVLTGTERRGLLDRYRQGPDEVRRSLVGVSAEMYAYRPFAEAWTIGENIVHLADAEANGYVRCRKAVAEPGASIAVYDEEGWTRTLHYERADLEQCLTAFTVLRELTHHFLTGLSEEEWNRSFYQHPESGRNNLDRWLQIYGDHAQFHRDLIERNKKLYREGKH
jgi:DinB superfamily